jgi:hypothetical protein
MSSDHKPAESALVRLLRQQKVWATQQAHEIDARGYVESVNANLWRPLSGTSRAAFEKGSGSELKGKMCALHSSSALAVNFFDYWTSGDRTALRKLLDLTSTPCSVRFEAQYPTGLRGTPPNIDVSIALESGDTLAIESKFTEWLIRKSFRTPVFKAKYFPIAEELWNSKGLSACQSLAADIQVGRDRFLHFDAPQMLKHALGLATRANGGFSLWYIYFECSGGESTIHKTEIRAFAERVGREIGFKALTYQELFRRLETMRQSIDAGYIGYLSDRYFGSK